MSPRLSYLFIIPFIGLLAMVQSALGPRLALRGVRPDILLLVILAWTLIAGSYAGIVWGFWGGIWMDVMSGGPMGGSSLALMAAAAVVGLAYNRFFRSNILVPFLAAVIGTLIYSLVYMAVLFGVGHQLDGASLVAQLVIPSILYNSALMLLISPLLNRIPDRRSVS